ncbi:hypothetical protein QFZ66_000255 [Streptomyces sp. B4I13]|uniref:hypothetical protein n=1 Tax=unclassified Streptomyces TaxID=2593676 RepID=UPI0027885282|nr:hypothetical protein [Streptomyces sp. B4I13]MDQ0956377.1 hypothetical protein [Streptomyces sp. B4I13]
MPHHALEITLTRPLTPTALQRAARLLPLAANHEATRLIALMPAKTPHRALRRLRHRLGDRLPIDVITTHYPDADHRVLLNVAFPPAVHAALKAQARRAAQSPERFLELALHRALAEHADRETDRLDRAVRQLLAHTSPGYLLSAVGQALTRLPESPTP